MKYLKLYLLLLTTLAATATTRAQRVMTLQNAVESACRNNADLQKKRLDVESMKEVKKEIYTKYFPDVEISGTGFWRSKGFAQGSDVLNTAFSLFAAFKDEETDDIDAKILKYGAFAGLKAVLPIYTGGRLTSANKLAELGIKAKGEMAAIKEEELTQEVEKYFWQLVQLYEAEEMLNTMDSLVDRAGQDASLALRAGLVTTNDKMEVDLYASELESTHLQIDNGKKLCREYLAYLTGVDELDSVVWSDIYSVKEPAEYFAGPTSALCNRHETKLLQMQKDAAVLQKKFTLGSYLPTVGAIFSYSYHYLSAKDDAGVYHQYFDKNKFGWWVGANVSIPISEWWGGKHKLRRANIAIKQAEIDFSDKQKLMKVEMSQKWNTLTEKYKQIDVAQKRMEQAEQNRKQHASAYRSGASTMTDRLHADALYEKARTNYIDACIKYRLAITEYRHATGSNSIE